MVSVAAHAEHDQLDQRNDHLFQLKVAPTNEDLRKQECDQHKRHYPSGKRHRFQTRLKCANDENAMAVSTAADSCRHHAVDRHSVPRNETEKPRSNTQPEDE